MTIDVPYDTASVERDAQKKKDFNIDDYFMFSRIVSFDLHAQNPVTLLNDDKTYAGILISLAFIIFTQ